MTGTDGGSDIGAGEAALVRSIGELEAALAASPPPDPAAIRREVDAIADAFLALYGDGPPATAE